MGNHWCVRSHSCNDAIVLFLDEGSYVFVCEVFRGF